MGIILGILIIVIIAFTKSPPTTTQEIAECIGDKSTLYIQLGCHACETQKNMFGENYQYLNIIDCVFESCPTDIKVTPTWKIGNQYYEGVQSIETLQELTKC